MNPGRMDRKLTIQRRTTGKDATGARADVWHDAFQTWGEVVNNRKDRENITDAERGTETRAFRIRWKDGLTTTDHRVLYQLKFYRILNIVEEGRRNRLLLDCQAYQALTHA